MSQVPTARKKPKKDNPVKEFFAEFRMGHMIEMVLSIVWNVFLFIPRVMIRMISNMQ